MSEPMSRREFLRFAGLSGAGLTLAALLPEFITRRYVRATLEFRTCIPWIDQDWHHVVTTWSAPNEMVDVYVDRQKMTGETDGIAGFIQENIGFEFNDDLSEYGISVREVPPVGGFFYEDEHSMNYHGWETAEHHKPMTVKKVDDEWVIT